MSWSDGFSVAIMLVGVAFLLLAGIGILRMPDVFMRASATTKAATLGVGCVMVAVAIHFADLRVTTRVVATISFLFLTAPVAAHMIAGAAYLTGVPLWEGTIGDELEGKYQLDSHRLDSPHDQEDPPATNA